MESAKSRPALSAAVADEQRQGELPSASGSIPLAAVAPSGAPQKPIPATLRPLRLLVDARKLGEGGIGAYTEALVEGFLAEPRISLGVIVRNLGRLPHHWRGRVSAMVDDSAEYSFSGYWGLSSRIDMEDYDLLHVPHYTLPFRVSIPAVVTVHDLIQLRYPRRFFHPPVVRYLVRSAIRRSAATITVSEAVKKDLISTLKLSEAEQARLTVIPNSVRPSSFFTAADRDRILAERGIQRPFWLAVVSTARKHKDLRGLIDGYTLLCQGFRAEGLPLPPRLVCVGQGIQPELLRSFGGNAVGSGGILALGDISRAELDVLYSAARAVIVPSLDEGFCLPMLEAHTQGTPVVARPVPAIVEQALPGDVIAKDFSLLGLVAALSESAMDREGVARLRLGRSLQSPQGLPRFAASRNSEQLLGVYRRIVFASVGQEIS